jgi:hypothetical protein
MVRLLVLEGAWDVGSSLSAGWAKARRHTKKLSNLGGSAVAVGLDRVATKLLRRRVDC